MKILIYKGFDQFFLKNIETKHLNDKPYFFENFSTDFKKIKRDLERRLAILDENSNDEYWMTYDEYSLVYEIIDNMIDNYNIKVECVKNNYWPDCYPLLGKISKELFEEYSDHKERSTLNTKQEILNLEKIYSDIYVDDGKFYCTYYNHELDRPSKIKATNFKQENITLIKSDKFDDSSIRIYINNDYNSFIRAHKLIVSKQYSRVLVSSIKSSFAQNIVNSLFYICQAKNVELFIDDSGIEGSKDIIDDCKKIARNELKIPNFQDFRKLKLYENPDLNNNLIEVSQGEIISQIIKQAELSYQENTDFRSRDVFITAPTGSGKSIMFQIPAVYLANKYKKLTIVIEPVIALMEDQKTSLIKRGFTKVECINSNLITQAEKQEVIRKVDQHEVDILYLSPETLLSYSLEQLIGSREVGLVVVDEAHIVTTWGVGFRPDYWYLGSYINRTRTKPKWKKVNYKIHKFPVCTFTATAINGGKDDTLQQTIDSLCLANPIKYLGSVKRTNIKFNICCHDSKEEKIAKKGYKTAKAKTFRGQIDKYIKTNQKTISYFPYASIASNAYNGVEEFDGLGALASTNKVGIYTGRNTEELSKEEFKAMKNNCFEKFRSGEFPIMLATKAFGMGVDVSDILNVYHYAISGNLSDYVQEIGRAARKTNLIGTATMDFFESDLNYMNRLFGMSQINHYQLMRVLSAVYETYKIKENRNFTISPQSINFIFNARASDPKEIENQLTNKLKTCLLMLEKDLAEKYSFKVLISRPRGVFTKAYVTASPDSIELIKKSKYKEFFDWGKMDIGRKNKDNGFGETITDPGNIYKIDLKGIWENFYPNITIGQFKMAFFNLNDTKYNANPDSIKVMPELKGKIYNRQKITIKSKKAPLNELKSKLSNDLNTIINIMWEKFSRVWFTSDDLAKNLSKVFGTAKGKLISTTLFEIIDFKQANGNLTLYSRLSSDGLTQEYYLYSNKFNSHLKSSLYSSELISELCNEEGLEISLFKPLAANSADSKVLKLLSIFDYITYEVLGGEDPEIFIRLNDPRKIKYILNGTIRYSNNYVDLAKEKHDRDVAVLHKFVCELNEDNERWNYIEDYFLGKNVL